RYLYGDTFKASLIPLSFSSIKEGSRINNNMGSIVEVYDAKILNNQSNFDKLLDDDDVRLCLLLALDFVFMGYEMRHVIANELLNLVDDFGSMDRFPMGELTCMD
ncbi:hypothetical protein Tco_0902817, partial [Tanacetum coccineum]